MSHIRLGILLTIALSLTTGGVAAATPSQGVVKLPDEAGLIVLGAGPNDRVGISLAGPGDVDGDGRADLLAGGATPSGASEDQANGAAYMLRGGPAGVLALSGPDLPPALGYSIRGKLLSGVMGDSASRVGDVNANGRPDVAVRLLDGRIFVVYGRTGQRPAVRVDQDLPAADGFSMKTGSSIGPIASAGDFNGDGVGDLVVGSPGAQTPCMNYYDCDPWTGLSTAPSSVTIVFGRATRSGPPLDLSTLSSADGVTITLPASPVSDVEPAGDVNGDGFGDVIVGMPEQGNGGRGYVIYGAATPPSFTIGDDDLPQSRGYALKTDQNGARLGTAVAGVGDVNGDKLPDVAVGAPGYSGGRAWIVHSRKLSGAVTLSSAAAPEWQQFAGSLTSAEFGSDLAAVGDVNGDGRGDLAVAAPGFSAKSGAAWVMHAPGPGQTNAMAFSGALQSGRGFVIRPSETGAGAGMRIAALGNGQLAVGFPDGGGAKAGAVYVVPLKTPVTIRRTLPNLSAKLAKAVVVSGSTVKLALKTSGSASVAMRLFRIGDRKSCALRRANETAAACTPELIPVGGSARSLGGRTQGTRSATFPSRLQGKKLAKGKYLVALRASDGKSRSLLRTLNLTVK